MAGYLGVEEQATQTIIGNMASVLYVVFLGFMFGACVIVGNKIGANKPQKALYYIGLTAKISISSCLFVISLLFFFR
jgi:Na+-driven multidrug efflux pump